MRVSAQGSSGRTARVCVIGHTGQGNYGHAMDLAWTQVPGVEIVGVADADPVGRDAARTRLGGIPTFDDYRRMVVELRPDIVAICPRHAHEHRDMIVAAIEAGARGVYVEKPFVRTCAEGDEVVALAGARRVTLAVAHRNRHHPALGPFMRELAAGTFGRVIEIRARGKEDHRGGGQDLWVLGGHLFNIATLFSGPATACTAGIYQDGRPATRADVRDGEEGVGPLVGDEVHARFETSSGTPLFYDSKKANGSTRAGFGLQVVCSEALVDLRMDVEPLIQIRQGNLFEPTAIARPWVPFTSAGFGHPEPVQGLPARILSHAAAVEDLLDAMRSRREPLCGPAAALHAVEMTQAVFASFATNGRRVTLPLAQRTSPLA